MQIGIKVTLPNTQPIEVVVTGTVGELKEVVSALRASEKANSYSYNFVTALDSAISRATARFDDVQVTKTTP